MLRRSRVATFAGLLAAIVGVAACSGGPEPTPSASPSPSQTPTQTPSPSPSSTPSASVSPSPSPSGSPLPSAVIEILTPAVGAAVSVPIAMSGTANTFEAALTVDAVTAVGDILCSRHISATSGSGTRGTWQTSLDFAPPSERSATRATLRAYELSAKDGSMINLVERNVDVSPVRPVIVLTSPNCGDVVAPGGNLAITGLATVFEAALSVDLRDQAGVVVFSTNLLTEEGGVESLFSDIVTLPASVAPGWYDVVAYNISARDGSIENEFSVQIAVQS